MKSLSKWRYGTESEKRLYYSCFYKVIALLTTEGIHPVKHTTARAFLNKN